MNEHELLHTESTARTLGDVELSEAIARTRTNRERLTSRADDAARREAVLRLERGRRWRETADRKDPK